MEVTKTEWKLFQERIVGWQEAYMGRLNQKYVQLLCGSGNASDRFWALEKRIREDKNKPGVQLTLKKSEVGWNLLALLRDQVITEDDLDGFSEDLKGTVLRLYRGEV